MYYGIAGDTDESVGPLSIYATVSGVDLAAFRACLACIFFNFREIIYFIQLFVEAFEKGQFVEVSLVLSAVKCALYSQNEDVVRLALQFFTQISDETYEMANKSYHQQVVSWFVKVVKQTFENNNTAASSPPTP